jgi:phytoene synthase
VITLEHSYSTCRALARKYGKTYYAATYALPQVKRHHVWALYAFCRLADDIVDEESDAPAVTRASALAAFGDRFFRDLDAGDSEHPALKAVVHTVKALGHEPDLFRRFLRSMAMDVSVSRYETWEDLLDYMDGSAAVIGEMMLPVLEPSTPDAVEPARSLGLAFQLTNFLRDVDEDLVRGRVYIPQEDLRRFDAHPSSRRVDDAWVALMRFEIARCRRLYATADEGIAMLPPASARCVRAARVLYARILDHVERRNYDVFRGRVHVPSWQKAAIACRLALQPMQS